MRTAETLIRKGGCPGWSESSLGAKSFVGFVMRWLIFVLQKNGVDIPDGRMGRKTESNQNRKSKRKSGKKMKSAQRRLQTLNQLQQPSLQQQPNLTGHQTDLYNSAVSQNGVPNETGQNGVLHEIRQNGAPHEIRQASVSHETRQFSSPVPNLSLSKQKGQTSRGHSGPKTLPNNQVLPFNSDTMSQRLETMPQPPTSKFSGQSAWRKAGLVSQIVTQPTIARRKHTLEISDVGNPDSETEVYESTYMWAISRENQSSEVCKTQTSLPSYRYYTNQTVNNKDTEQIARMRRLICEFVVSKFLLTSLICLSWLLECV